MQGSKIEVGAIYAVNDAERGLQRFRVEAVVTTRVGKHPTDFSYIVKGRIIEQEPPEGTVGTDNVYQRAEVINLPASALLGDYTAHKELLDRKLNEDRAKADLKAKHQSNAEYLLGIIVSACDLPQTGSLNSYHNPARLSHSNGIDLGPVAVEAMLNAIRAGKFNR